MRPILKSAQLAILLILTIVSLSLFNLFIHHYRLISVHGQAELRQGRVALVVIPGLGYVLDLLRRPLPLIGLVLMPAASMVWVELRHLWRSYARPGYSARLET